MPIRPEIGADHWPKIAVAIATGTRRGNLFRLRWEDVDFDAGIVTVRRTKSGETYHVPVNDDLRAVLRALPSRLRSPWVFPSEAGETPLDSQNFINRHFAPALVKAAIKDFHWHDLRHTFGSRLAMAGVPLLTIREPLGRSPSGARLKPWTWEKSVPSGSMRNMVP